MAENTTHTLEKALSLNLDPLTYGTIAEIGAGQEVARWFFQAGASAGTVAKTMSAYDMQFSDEIYGQTPGQRYVSRERLERMLAREFDLIVSRIQDHRPEGTRFFAFANTVAAQGYKKRSECHGWLGVRFQMEPKSEPDEIIVHVRMLDETNLDQQEALGILGVNLIHGAFNFARTPEKFLVSLMDNLRWGRLEIDLVEFRGPNLGAIDNRLMALELVKASLTRAVLFDSDGKVVIPADALYKKRVLTMRGNFNTVEQTDIDLFAHGKQRFQKDTDGAEILSIAEMTMANLAVGPDINTTDFLARMKRLSDAGYYVLISEFFRYFRLRQYLARYTKEPVAMVTDVEGLGDILREDYYDNLPGEVLEGVGQTFPEGTTAYIYPTRVAIKSLSEAPIDKALRLLLAFLEERKQIVLVDDYDVAPR